LSLEIKTQISENETQVFERKWKEREKENIYFTRETDTSESC
jgi:hypothetical protein